MQVNFMEILFIFKILTRNVLEKRLKISSNLAEAFPDRLSIERERDLPVD